LILDEATSSLDPTAELYVQKAVEYLTALQKTVIVIAHRLSTVQHAHKIMVLHEGELAEEGNHQELIAMKGRYYNLWAQQMPMEYQEQ
jgi:ABC-type multidrug transport system fused ATPase/permease subunit